MQFIFIWWQSATQRCLWAGGYFIYFIFNYALQPLRLIVRSGLDVPPPGVSTRVTTREHPAAEGGTVGEKCQVNFA